MLLSAILDATIDSLKMLPFLFVAYFIIEYIEHNRSEAMQRIITGGGRFGFLSGAILGLIPQCGFSAMAADLYSSGVITLGTLLAVFISTSDEAIPILLSYPKLYSAMLYLLLFKLAIAATFGYIIDKLSKSHISQVNEIDCHEHEENDSVLKAAIKHTLHIFIFIYAITILLNIIMLFPWAENIIGAINEHKALQLFACALIGMIPNCASSVLLTQLYASGSLSLAALIAGLCTGAGIGPVVLIRTCKDKKQVLKILSYLYLIGVFAGVVAFIFFK